MWGAPFSAPEQGLPSLTSALVVSACAQLPVHSYDAYVQHGLLMVADAGS
jgi:hypothetical protein